MTRFSEQILDMYDDEDGIILKSIINDINSIPPLVKVAQHLTHSQIDKLSDDHFALVLYDNTQKFKKYATVDEGNTILSVLYFIKQSSLMPDEIATATANNLLHALDMYNIPAPEELKKIAKKNPLTTTVPGKSQKPYTGKVHQLQYPEILEDPKESHDNPQLGKYDSAWGDVNQRTNAEGTPGSNFLELPSFPQKEKYKVASDLEIVTKTKIYRESPYFDVSDLHHTPPILNQEAEFTLLNGHYPVDSYDQVKTASSYFIENKGKFDFRDRHTYCVKLASRMSDLGITIPEDIARYGATTYSADVDSYVESRRSYIDEYSYPILDMLLEKRAYVSPEVFVESLAEFDRLNDLNWHWDSKLPDPWYSTFGPSTEKLAQDNWSWNGVGTRIDEDDLKDLAINEYDKLSRHFGEDFAKEFSKHPKTVFTSLPDPTKLLLARFASDRLSGISE